MVVASGVEFPDDDTGVVAPFGLEGAVVVVVVTIVVAAEDPVEVPVGATVSMGLDERPGNDDVIEAGGVMTSPSEGEGGLREHDSMSGGTWCIWTLGAWTRHLRFSATARTMASRYCLLLAFSCRVTTSG